SSTSRTSCRRATSAKRSATRTASRSRSPRPRSTTNPTNTTRETENAEERGPGPRRPFPRKAGFAEARQHPRRGAVQEKAPPKGANRPGEEREIGRGRLAGQAPGGPPEEGALAT